MRIEAEDMKKKETQEEAFVPVKNERRTIRSEFAKMKAMGLKDGWEYFWSYYRMPVIVTVIVIAMIISIATSVIQNSRPYVVQVHIYNNYLNEDADVEALEKEFTEYEGKNLKDYQIVFDFEEYLDFTATDENSYTSLMKVMAMAAATDFDVLGGNTAFMNNYGIGDPDSILFGDLEDILPAKFFQFLKEQNRILYLKQTDENGNTIDTYAAGIEVSDTRIVNDNYLLITPCYLGIACNTTRQEASIDFLEWIFDYQE